MNMVAPQLLLQRVSGENKKEAVRTELRNLACKLGPGIKLPTVKEMSEATGVSKVTLERVLDVLEDEGVIRRRRGSGIYVSSSIGQKAVGLVFGRDIFKAGMSPFSQILIEHCSERARTHQESFSFFLDISKTQVEGKTISAHRDLVDALERKRLHGLLMVVPSSYEQIDWLKSQGVPVVMFTVDVGWPGVVNGDTGHMVDMGVEALAARGCRRIGMISSCGYIRADFPDWNADLAAYAESLKRLGLEFRAPWVWENRVSTTAQGEMGPSNEEMGYRAMMELFGQAASLVPDGVVITDDMYARGALVAAKKLGIEIGKDLHIATHANKGSPVLQGYESQLTRMEMDLQEVAEAMFSMLESQMSGHSTVPDVVLVKTKLIAPSLTV